MMSPAPISRSGRVLVVVDGPARIKWRRDSPAEWVPTALWPDRDETAELRKRLARREPLLVVLDCGPPTVALLADEFAQAPPEVAALADQPDEEPTTLRIPLLDWLPPALRRRGLRFRREVGALAARIPRALLPALLLEPPSGALPQLRFAVRLAPCPPAQLLAVGRHAFASTLMRANPMMPVPMALVERKPAHVC